MHPLTTSLEKSDSRRFHSLDQLRAIMMVLGLVLHSIASYTRDPIGGAWPYHDANNHFFFSLLVMFIHLFRMPLFFLMAGFFAALLYHRRGSMGMLRNRTVRIVVPFVLFLAVLFPATQSGFEFAQEGGPQGGWEAAAAYLASPAGWYAGLTTIHLWFLYYLILFYVAILLIVPPLERLMRGRTSTVATALGRWIHHPLGLLACSATTFLSLLPMSYAGLDTEVGFLVQPKVLAAYGVFVTFGWLLYLNRDQVDGFARHAWTFMALGGVLSALYLTLHFSHREELLLLGKVTAALAMWTLIYGFLGLFVRYYDRPNPYGRYLSDASYWLYLTHLPLTIWVPGLLTGWAVSAFVKSGVTLAVTTILTVVSYHLLVRSGVIGLLLNGKRYPRALPRFDAEGNYLRPQAGEVR
jgi:fucose 4-O-acetylase-like acetyltransferase